MTTTEIPGESGAELQPLLAGWLKSRTEFVDTTKRTLHRTAHRTTWHAIRGPLYALQLILLSPRGCGRALRSAWYFITDQELHPLRVEAVTASDPQTAMRLRKERNERIHTRLLAGAWLVLPVLAGCVFAYLVAPRWVTWLMVLAGVLVLGWVGRPRGKPLVKPATVLAGNHGPLRAPFVMEALTSLGIGGMRDVDSIGLLFDVARVGLGYQVDLELPRGVAATTVMEKRSQLSSALRRELGCVWPSVGSRHEGHLVLYVSDQPMATAKQAAWPLLKAGSVNLFKPTPLFTDQRNHWIEQVIAYTAWIVGAVPRMGKTYFVRQFGLVAGLDVRAKVFAFDLKGTGDLSPLALFAHAYCVGDEDEEIAEQLAHMRWVHQEMRRRVRAVRELTIEENPEKGKITDALASADPDKYGPIVICVDECQVWFEEHASKAVREEFIGICRDLTKRGPAVAIVPLCATQKPDAKSIPTSIAANASARVAFKTNDQISNDQILGTSSYKQGLRSTLFAFAEKGLAYFRGDGADAQIVRSVWGLDAAAAEKVALRARSARVAAGRLSGHAAGEVMDREADQVVLLEDVRHVFQGAAAMHLSDIREGLSLLRPGIYSHLDNGSLAALLRGADVAVDNVYVSGKARQESTNKGVKREWLEVSTTRVIGDEDDDEDDGGAAGLLTVVR